MCSLQVGVNSEVERPDSPRDGHLSRKCSQRRQSSLRRDDDDEDDERDVNDEEFLAERQKCRRQRMRVCGAFDHGATRDHIIIII